MSRRIALSLIGVLSMLMLVACGVGKLSPEKVAGDFMSAVKNFEVKNIEDYMSEELREAYNESIEEQSGEMTLEDMMKTDGYRNFEKSIKSLTGKMKYEITNVDTDSDNSEVNVKLTYPDASEPLMASTMEMFGQLMGLAFSGQEPTEEEISEIIFDIFSSNLDGYEADMKDTEGVLTLSKIDDKWIIIDIDDDLLNGLSLGLQEADLGDILGDEMEFETAEDVDVD